jgi:DNA-directed RNA polymerase subunit RPC12/RpoP
MAKHEAAMNRLFKRVFVCKNCKTKTRTDINRIIQGKISCKNCGGKAFRPIKKAK